MWKPKWFSTGRDTDRAASLDGLGEPATGPWVFVSELAGAGAGSGRPIDALIAEDGAAMTAYEAAAEQSAYVAALDAEDARASREAEAANREAAEKAADWFWGGWDVAWEIDIRADIEASQAVAEDVDAAD